MNAERRVYQMTLQKYDVFKTQNPEIGGFDVIFEVGGKLLYAHKNMLTLVSDTFNSMLSDRWTPNKDEPIKIKDYSYDDFFQFLTFLYSGECQLTAENIFKMVDIAEFYGVDLFKEFCDEYLTNMTITNENIFPFMELTDKYSMVQLKASVLAFITGDFQSFANSDGFLNLDKSIIEKLVAGVKDKVKPEDLFLAVYKWCEKQAKNSQIANPNVNSNDQIKAEISDFLSNIHFRQMELQFLLEFVVRKGFIFSSFDELSTILSESFIPKNVTVKITNLNGQTLHGNVIPDKMAIKNIESLNLSTCFYGYDKWCSWNTVFNVPLTPSPLKKRDCIDWYLFYWGSGEIGVRHHTELREDIYLLAELTPGSTGFQTAKGCKIEIK